MSTILIVEDEAIIARDIQNTLQGLGYRAPRTAVSGADALRAIEEIQPDLVLMDIHLKGNLDGIETTARMRARWNIPVIYLTAHSDEATLSRAKETAPHGYLLKPFHDRDLRTAIEIALRKSELESKLAERERWFSTTLESIGDAVIATDPAGVITFMNPLSERLTGFQRDDAIGKPIGEVLRLVDEKGARIENPVGRAMRERFRVELPQNVSLLPREGTGIVVDDSASAIVDCDGELIGGVVIFRDITERKRMERRLAQSEKLASIGTLAAGMAHEVNNPLAAVIGNLAFASEKLGRTLNDALPEGLRAQLSECLDSLADAGEAASRVRQIVADLKKFAREGRAEKQVLDLPDVLNAALKLTEHQLRHCARLEREYATTPFVYANEGQLVQVFINLLVNAAQAIGEGRASENRIAIMTRTDQSGRAVVEVRDTGCGMSEQVLKHIFDPFFSTKSAGDGMGLGLSICHGIVESSGGDISVDSAVGRGTVFRVSLPPAPFPAEPTAAAPGARTTAPRGRLMIIDDDAAVCRMVARLLRHDHEVVTQSDPRAALAVLSRDGRFDLILCDLMMPEMSGTDVYWAIHSTHPELARRIVFLTGGSFSERTTKFLDSVDNLTLTKPFTVEALRAVIAEHLCVHSN